MKSDASRFWWVVLSAVSLLASWPVMATPGRERLSLDGEWEFRRWEAQEGDWKKVTVPSAFEIHEGMDFDGVGIYGRNVSLTAEPGRRVLLHVQAAATATEIFWNGTQVGSHLGGWTPFRCDITSLLAQMEMREYRLEARVDELVGHNTQGFLPIIQPHFGGLWQSVELLTVSETYIDDLALKAIGNVETGLLELEVPISGAVIGQQLRLRIRTKLKQDSKWQESFASVTGLKGSDHVQDLKVAVPGFLTWSPSRPNLYDVEISLLGLGGSSQEELLDQVTVRAAFRKIEVFGQQLRLNGQPLQVRGVLNWGYYPPGLAPLDQPDRFRKDLEYIRSRGFNLMKFCLWIPPRSFLDLADEMGVLTWMEYPTWHPRLDKENFEALKQEFQEFFLYDRNHPSLILRSLTCETGPSADLSVIQTLYDMAHSMIPGAVVEDDSSWIAWNRVHDFYDDHPYGNNDTWLPTLRRLNEYILGHGLKPLVLGEAMAADTWVPDGTFSTLTENVDHGAYWRQRSFDQSRHWIQDLRARFGEEAIANIESDSLRYAMLMRKYQAEIYRREVPFGGYVTSVIRDFPLASMGLLDFEGRPKWKKEDWSWQSDTQLILSTESDRRSFSGGERFQAELSISHFKRPFQGGILKVVVESGGEEVAQIEQRGVSLEPGTLSNVLHLDFQLPEVDAPRQLLVTASLEQSLNFVYATRNQWSLWVVPRTSDHAGEVFLHPSCLPHEFGSLLPSAVPLTDSVRMDAAVVTRVIDEGIRRRLQKGGKVLLLPNNSPGSYRLADHWFLRGAPFIPGNRLEPLVPRTLLVELQHFDLSGKVIPELTGLNEMEPILLLWDTHDLAEVKTHGLVFEAKVGQGRLVVSALNHAGETNAAGRYLLVALLRHMIESTPPDRTLAWATLDASLIQQELPANP